MDDSKLLQESNLGLDEQSNEVDWVESVSDIVFLASAYEVGGWEVPSLAVSSVYSQCAHYGPAGQGVVSPAR